MKGSIIMGGKPLKDIKIFGNVYPLSVRSGSGDDRSLTTVIGKGADLGTGHGYTVSDDGLENGYVPVKLQDVPAVPQNAVAAHYNFAMDALFIYCEDGLYIKHVPSNYNYSRVWSAMAGVPCMLDIVYNGYYCTAIVSGKNKLIFNGYNMSSTDKGESIYTGVMHHGRFFGRDNSDKYRIRWTGGSITDWTAGIDGAGYLRLDTPGGPILRLFGMDDKLIVIRQFGVTVMKAGGDPREFGVVSDHILCDDVIEFTCALCGNLIYFCTKTGIYAFDGENLFKPMNIYEQDLSEYSYGVGFGTKYIVICHSKSFDGKIIYVYDSLTGSGGYVNLEANCLCSGKTITAFNNEGVYELQLGTGQYKSAPVTFYTSFTKKLKALFADCDQQTSMIVTNGSDTVDIVGTGLHNMADMTGDMFTVTVSGGTVRTLYLEAEVLNNGDDL